MRVKKTVNINRTKNVSISDLNDSCKEVNIMLRPRDNSAK